MKIVAEFDDYEEMVAFANKLVNENAKERVKKTKKQIREDNEQKIQDAYLKCLQNGKGRELTHDCGWKEGDSRLTVAKKGSWVALADILKILGHDGPRRDTVKTYFKNHLDAWEYNWGNGDSYACKKIERKEGEG